MMNYLRHMEIFARIVESGSISAAATGLGRSKSVISQQLKSLEQELGVSLLNRTTRRQVLTPAGRDFYQQCLRISEISRQAWDDARETQQLPQGSISISAPNALIETVVAPAVGSLVAQHGAIQPTILADDERVDLIRDGIDLAVRVGELPSSGYRQRLLGQFRDVLCASPGYAQQQQLSEGRLLTDPGYRAHCDYIANSWQGKAISHHCRHRLSGKVAELSFSASRFCDSVHSVLAMAKAGAGLAFIPDLLFRPAQREGKLVSVLDDYVFNPVPVYAVHSFGNQPPLLVRLCIEAILEQMQRTGGAH